MTTQADRIRRCSTSDELERTVDDLVTRGYEVENRGQGTVLLEENTGWGSFGKHVLLLIFTFWTFGLANLAYALYVHTQGETVLVKTDRPTDTAPQDRAQVRAGAEA